jgi:(R,R)-butanediol dehydrogenase/meso-butanediol dehydrogenase/diacetyl reductase
MKAGVYRGIREIVVEEACEPEVTSNGIVIEVNVCGICGSDLHAFNAGLFALPGQIMGHEFAGDVIAVGPQVDGITVGDRVSAMPLVPCWGCPACQAGQVQRCARALDPGIGYGLPGAFAERVHIPDARFDKTVFQLPESLSYEDGSLLEPLAVAIQAVKRSAVTPEDVVVVTGLGPIGQLVARVLRARGVKTVVGVELSPERRACAERAGIQVADGRNGLATGVAAVLGDDAVVTAVIECAGSPTLPTQAVELVAQGGTVTIVALYEKPAPIDIAAFAPTEVTVRGCLCYVVEDFIEAIRLIREGIVRPGEIVTGRTDLAGLPDAFEQLSTGAGAIKVLVAP